MKRARDYWENRFQTQAIPYTSKHRVQEPTGSVKAPRTVQLSTKSIKSSRAGKTPNHRARGVMSLRSISTKRAMKVMTLGINITQERQSGKDNAEQGSAVDRNDEKKRKKQKNTKAKAGGNVHSSAIKNRRGKSSKGRQMCSSSRGPSN